MTEIGARRIPAATSRCAWKQLATLAALVIVAGAAGTAAANPPLALTEVADGVYVHSGVHTEAGPANDGGISNLGAVIGSKAIAVVDTGGSQAIGRRLRAAIERISDLPIAYVINTHVHPDHVFGNAAFEGGDVQFIGHAKLPRSLGARAPHYLRSFARLIGPAFDGTRAVGPTRTVDDRLEIDLGGRTLLVEAHPTAHTDNDLTVFDARTGVLFAGDLVFMRRIPVVDGSLPGWVSLSEKLKAYPAKLVVPGHGPASAPWPAALADQSRYLGALLADVRAVIARSGTIEQAIVEAASEERGRWLLFEDNHPRNVTAGFAELEWE